MERDLPEGVVDADPAGGWDENDDREAQERGAEAADAEALLTDAALRPDDPLEGEAVRRGADPDLATDAERGEEP
ncbi:hypothetical protein [Microbacterium cremeum]|uniref:hypothetical protein n=1 Tax=Microbacterium cremeum TaxID=2782169 RepID=UPI001889B496|nr:hypothetical protein [Microbacterium cremeum]